MIFAPGEAKHVRTTLQRAGKEDYSLLVESSPSGKADWVAHARAQLAFEDAKKLSRAKAPIGRGANAREGLGAAQAKNLGFGARWSNVRWVECADREVTAEVELPREFAADASDWMAHPALTDTSATIGLHLFGTEIGQGDVFAPMAINRVQVSGGRWPQRFRSRARLTYKDERIATFDVQLGGVDGKLLASFEGLTLRRLSRGGMELAAKPASLLAQMLAAGIRSTDAPELFARLLNSPARQIVVSSIALSDLRFSLSQRTIPPSRQAARAQAAEADYDSNVERKIAEFWAELLGAEAAKPDDDFFSLGGTSLTAIRLVAKIRKEFGATLPLATLFQVPTLRELAAYVADKAGLSPAPAAAAGSSAEPKQGPSPESEWSPLVRICKGTSDHRPLFCVHGGGGNVLGFREISQRLGKDYPFYGLQARGVDGVLAPLTDIGDMARLYIEAVKTVDHSGPYCLAGYSGGGVVAFEMAQQLRQQGLEVPLLVMFDTLSPVASIKEMRLKDKLKAARNLDVRYVLDWPALKRRRRQKHNYLKELQEKLLPGEPVPHELLETTLMDAYLTAQSRYEPRAYTGSLLLFRASQADLRYTWAGASLGWAAFAQPRRCVGGQTSLSWLARWGCH